MLTFTFSCDMLRPMTSWSTDNLTSSIDVLPRLTCSQFSKYVLWPMEHSAYSFSPAPQRTGLMVSSTMSAVQIGLRHVLEMNFTIIFHV